jgi:hypothetical protein
MGRLKALIIVVLDESPVRRHLHFSVDESVCVVLVRRSIPNAW